MHRKYTLLKPGLELLSSQAMGHKRKEISISPIFEVKPGILKKAGCQISYFSSYSFLIQGPLFRIQAKEKI
jgi:hypothetical protein